MWEYTDTVRDHFLNPRNAGVLEDANVIGEAGSLACGDALKLMLKVSPEGVIEDAKFQTFGCGAAVATSSMATELVKGKTVQEALQLTNKAVMEALDGLPAVKVHCSVLAEEAIRAALVDYYKRQGIDPEPIVGCSGECSECHHDHGHGEEEE